MFSDRNNGSESVVLCAASEEEKKEWVKALCYYIYADKGGGMNEYLPFFTVENKCLKLLGKVYVKMVIII
jgi:hypothetical protein